jgi:hypothetical protein
MNKKPVAAMVIRKIATILVGLPFILMVIRKLGGHLYFLLDFILKNLTKTPILVIMNNI